MSFCSLCRFNGSYSISSAVSCWFALVSVCPLHCLFLTAWFSCACKYTVNLFLGLPFPCLCFILISRPSLLPLLTDEVTKMSSAILVLFYSEPTVLPLSSTTMHAIFVLESPSVRFGDMLYMNTYILLLVQLKTLLHVCTMHTISFILTCLSMVVSHIVKNIIIAYLWQMLSCTYAVELHTIRTNWFLSR